MNRRWRGVIVALVVSAVGLAAACEAAPGSSGSAGPASTEVAVLPPPANAQVLACLSIGLAECEHVAQRVLATLPGAKGAPFSIQIRLFRCLDEAAPCPETLAVRQGQALVEYPDSDETLLLRLAGPPAAPVIEPVAGVVWSDPIQPGSPPVEDEGPFPFDVGHCGLLHVVDFDGSFWVLSGQVDGEHQALVGSETGAIRLINRDTAQYTGTDDARFRLARFPGAKRFQLCD